MAIFPQVFPGLFMDRMNTAASAGMTESQASKLPALLGVCMCQRALVHKLFVDRHKEVEVWKFMQILLHCTRNICQQSGEILQAEGLLLENDPQELHRNLGKVWLKKTQEFIFLKFCFDKQP